MEPNYQPKYHETRTDAERRAWMSRLEEIIEEMGPWLNDRAFTLISEAVENDAYRRETTLVFAPVIFDRKAFIDDVMYAYGFDEEYAPRLVLDCLLELEETDGPGYVQMKRDRAINALAKFDYVSGSIVEHLEEMYSKHPYSPMLKTKEG